MKRLKENNNSYKSREILSAFVSVTYVTFHQTEMNHRDHVDLISRAIPAQQGIWADLGSGEGAFTLALADITDQSSVIYSVDSNKYSLERQREKFEQTFPSTDITYINKDFTSPLELPSLDGIIMANSLHYVRNQTQFLEHTKRYLKPDGVLIIVEYNTENGNQWVPYPVSFEKLSRMTLQTGYTDPRLIGRVPSNFLDEIYCASVQIRFYR